MKRQSSKSLVYLTEILLALAIFALCSSVCVGLFALSHRISGRSSALNHAIVVAQSYAEAFKANDTEEAIARAVEGSAVNEGPLIYFDAAWKAAKRESAAYVLSLNLRREGRLRFAEIVVSDAKGLALFALEATAHVEERP